MLARADSGVPGLRRARSQRLGGLDPGAYAAGLYDVASSRLTCSRALFGEPGAYAGSNPGLTPPGYMMSPLRG